MQKIQSDLSEFSKSCQTKNVELNPVLIMLSNILIDLEIMRGFVSTLKNQIKDTPFAINRNQISRSISMIEEEVSFIEKKIAHFKIAIEADEL